MPGQCKVFKYLLSVYIIYIYSNVEHQTFQLSSLGTYIMHQRTTKKHICEVSHKILYIIPLSIFLYIIQFIGKAIITKLVLDHFYTGSNISNVFKTGTGRGGKLKNEIKLSYLV